MPHTHHQTAHLIYGPTAAGKSTLAQQMAAQINGVRFAIDEWMHAMFAEDMPDALEMRWVMSRVARCQNHIWGHLRKRKKSYAKPVAAAVAA